MVLVTVLLLVFGLEIATVIGADPPGGYYTTRYDHIDIENILNHKRLVLYYAACLLEQGPCTPQGTEFKNILPEAIKTNCLRCTEKQRSVTVHSIRRLRKEYPDIWLQLEKRWDPTGENVKRLLASANKPIPVPTETTLIADRFGGVEVTIQTSSGEQERIAPIPAETTTIQAANTTTISSTVTTTTMTTPTITTIFKGTTKTVTSRPFNSVGPNFIVLNPKALIDKVIFTADMVLKSVTGVFEG